MVDTAINPLVAQVLSGVIVGSVVGMVAAYLSYRFGLSGQIKIIDRQKRHETFGRLMGLKFLLMQLYVSRFEALVFSDYHEALWKVSGYEKESIHLQEAQRWMRKSEDLVLELARTSERVFETIGLIRAVFPATSLLIQLVDRLYGFKTPVILPLTNAVGVAQIEHWKTEAIKQLQRLVENEYGKPVDDLLNYLAMQMTT